MNLNIGEVWRYINRTDWDNRNFSLEKAYVCCKFSELAYHHVPDYELKVSRRVKIVPCYSYPEIVKRKIPTRIEVLLQQGDFGEFFVIESRFAIVIGIVIKGFLVIAIRGTYELYDWIINLNARKYILSVERNAKFHLGFYRAISACFTEISYEVKKRSKINMPIYVTGHSLGGAMAAILHTEWWRCPETILDSHSSYTFGMPRYGNTEATAICSPFHLYNELDIVPSVPPRWLGYENSRNEYRLDGKNLQHVDKRESAKFVSWLLRLFSGVGIRNHGIETYETLIKKHLP